METAQEQATIGGHCIHGTPTGTPGGYDLMCGLCEGGLMDWIESPRYALILADRAFGNVEWGDNTPSVARACKSIAKIFAVVTVDLGEWSARQVADGYWA
jgi:hypothetical protein